MLYLKGPANVKAEPSDSDLVRSIDALLFCSAERHEGGEQINVMCTCQDISSLHENHGNGYTYHTGKVYIY
jgi:hypothetical protein